MKRALITLSTVLFSVLAHSQISVRAYTGPALLPISDLNIGVSYGNQINFDSISNRLDLGIGVSYDFGEGGTWNNQEDEEQSGPNPVADRNRDGDGLLNFMEPWSETHVYSGYVRIGYHLIHSERSRLTLGTGVSLSRLKYRYVQSSTTSGSATIDLEYRYANYLDVGILGYLEYAYSIGDKTDFGLQLTFNSLLNSFDSVTQSAFFVEYHF
ncbi:MAG: hypothetical protein HWD92_07960 [Flavobacteriia bacterium]|nr:hypothetical protein [Flavobacteriia bacterium]